MQAALQLTTRIQPGGKIEVSDTQLPSGVLVDLIVLLPEPETPPHSIMDVLAQDPGPYAFKTVEEVAAAICQERDAGDS